MLSNQLILCHSLLLPSIFPSIRVFISQSALCIRWPKYWTPNYWSFSISPSNDYSELISFRIDRLYLLAVQGTLKGLLPHDSSKASILWHSAFFMVQLSHPCSTTGKTIVWLYRPLMAKWSLWFLIHGLVLSQHFFQGASIFYFVAAVTVHSDFRIQENKVCHCFHFFPHLFAMNWWDQMMPWS